MPKTLRSSNAQIRTWNCCLALGLGLGFALPEDQSMPHPYNRIITVGHLYFMCTDAAANAIQFAMMTKCFATCCGTARKFAY